MQKKEHYELVQKLVERFKEENGSIICRELLGLNVVHDKPEPEKRTEGYYKKRPCAEIVRSAAEIVDELLKRNLHQWYFITSLLINKNN